MVPDITEKQDYYAVRISLICEVYGSQSGEYRNYTFLGGDAV